MGGFCRRGRSVTLLARTLTVIPSEDIDRVFEGGFGGPPIGGHAISFEVGEPADAQGVPWENPDMPAGPAVRRGLREVEDGTE